MTELSDAINLLTGLQCFVIDENSQPKTQSSIEERKNLQTRSSCHR